MQFRYSVLLRHDIKKEDADFFKSFCDLVGNDDVERIHIRCSKLDAGHPIYLSVTAHKFDSDLSLKLSIPHYLVFLISDPIDDPTTIGFTA